MNSQLSFNDEVLQRAKPLRHSQDLQSLIENIKDQKIVMLGEASHGTQEFYYWRRLISQILIEQHGFQFIAVEGDWPPCQKVNQYVKFGEGGSAREVLKNFVRWPTWMWANTEILKLADWMREFNQKRPEGKRTGFYGLDVYSLFESIDEVLQQAQQIDPELERRLRERYACFDPYDRDEKDYVRSLFHESAGCEEQVLKNLMDLLQVRMQSGKLQREALFDATQNARIIKNAESYYRSMIQIEDESWNIRDRHMMETLEILMRHHGPGAKGIVWEHNTHIGDYRATDMVQYGHINIGGLAREQFGEENVKLVGFGSYQGTVIASHAWGGPIQKLPVPPGRAGSYESQLHACVPQVGSPNYFLVMDETAKNSILSQKMGHRAIGVVYDPGQERWGNYVSTSLARRYDAFIYLDQTEALKPLEIRADKHEIPETFPQGL